jgi:hypothetical protein
VRNPVIGDARRVLCQLLEGELDGSREQTAVERIRAAQAESPLRVREPSVLTAPFPPQQVIELLAEVWTETRL